MYNLNSSLFLLIHFGDFFASFFRLFLGFGNVAFFIDVLKLKRQNRQ